MVRKNPSGDVLGNRVKVKVVKNKIAPPFRKAEFDIMYNEGISRAGSILDVAVEMDIINKKGSWFSFEGRQLGQGREQAKEAIKTDDALATTVLDRVKTLLKNDGATDEEVSIED